MEAGSFSPVYPPSTEMNANRSGPMPVLGNAIEGRFNGREWKI